MKQLSIVIALGMSLMGGGIVWAADCPTGTFLKVIGTAQTAGADLTSITSQGHWVRAVRVSCGGTACVATLYDTTAGSGGTGGVVDADVKDEPGAPANESRWYTYDPPMLFANGIGFHDDGNVNGIITYECRP